jgi:SAM-dependent methyltransferase
LPSPSEDAQPKIAVDVSDRRAYDEALRDFYHPHYHDEKRATTRRAAERILPIVLSIVDVASIIDVGCGPGSWLEVAREMGVPTLTGVEGEWAAEWFDDDRVRSGGFDLVLANLEDELRPPATFDLALCIEVIEHLSPARGESFVADLCRCAGHVLFGAAIPGQKGPNHLNTRWPSYWAECFAAHGYLPLDVVRARVWGDDDLLVHHRQNPLLFVREDLYDRAVGRALEMAPPPLAALDRVHPAVYARRSKERPRLDTPGLRLRVRLAAGIPRAVVRRLRGASDRKR